MREEMSPGPEPDTRVLNSALPPPKADNGLLDFSGRISRSTFWLRFLLGIGILLAGAVLLDLERGLVTAIPGVLLLVLALWLNLATRVKRWHDLDLSGWFVALNMIPFFGDFVLIWQEQRGQIDTALTRSVVASPGFSVDPIFGSASLAKQIGHPGRARMPDLLVLDEHQRQ